MCRYPWESAFTGIEVIQPCCPLIAKYQQHITGDVSFAIRNYLALSDDLEWMKNEGCVIATEIAKFWASRAQRNDTSGYYDINHVMGSDEDHGDINNNVFTNVISGYALYFGQ